jgi:hypothetical protein
MTSSANDDVVSPFDLLDQHVFTSSDEDDSSGEEEEGPSVRGGLTSKHLDPIASRNWKAVLSWVTFHPDEVATLVDRDGQTTLHHACLFRAPLDVIEAMLYAAPELAKVPNDEGELVLHWAVRLALPLQVLAILLAENPASGFVKDQKGQSPFSLLWDRHHVTLVDVYRIYGRERTASFASWKRIMMLVEAYAKNDVDVEQSPLHAIVQCPCEPSFLGFAIQVCEGEINQRDEMDNLPLHLACSAPVDVDILSFVLEANPGASSATDGRGQLPLHLTIAAGKTWEGGVKIIFDANPSSLGTMDAEHRLYPFMLASISDQACDSTIYTLLRANPEYVRPLQMTSK